MRFILDIHTDNAAFDDDPIAEIRNVINRALRKLDDNLEGKVSWRRAVKLPDSNGVSCGLMEVVDYES